MSIMSESYTLERARFECQQCSLWYKGAVSDVVNICFVCEDKAMLQYEHEHDHDSIAKYEQEYNGHPKELGLVDGMKVL